MPPIEAEDETIETALRGVQPLNDPLLNKACAFSREERRELGLDGLLPHHVECLEDQLQRELEQVRALRQPINRHI